MQVAAEYAEAVCEGTGIGVKKGFLFDRVTLHPANVPPRDIQTAPFVEPHFANPEGAVWDRTAVSTGIAADAMAIERFVQLTFTGLLFEYFRERAHRPYDCIRALPVS